MVDERERLMRLHASSCLQKPQAMFAFTQDATGSKLPIESGPWQLYEEIEMAVTDKRISMDSKQAIEEIRSQGYFIVLAGIGDKSA